MKFYRFRMNWACLPKSSFSYKQFSRFSGCTLKRSKTVPLRTYEYTLFFAHTPKLSLNLPALIPYPFKSYSYSYSVRLPQLRIVSPIEKAQDTYEGLSQATPFPSLSKSYGAKYVGTLSKDFWIFDNSCGQLSEFETLICPPSFRKIFLGRISPSFSPTDCA